MYKEKESPHYSGKLKWPIGAKEVIKGHYEFGKYFKDDKDKNLKICIKFIWTNSVGLTIGSYERFWYYDKNENCWILDIGGIEYKKEN